MAFYVGQKVTQKYEDEWIPTIVGIGGSGGPHPKFGEVVTVKDVYISRYSGEEILVIAEYPNPGYLSHNFAPVVEPKVELPECLTALLDTSRNKETCGND